MIKEQRWCLNSKTKRIAETRALAKKIRTLCSDRHVDQFDEMEAYLKKMERWHREGGTRFTGSVPEAVDYFIVRCFDHAYTWHNSGDAERMKWTIGGLRTDHLLAISILGRYKLDFQRAGLTPPVFMEAVDLLEYVRDFTRL